MTYQEALQKLTEFKSTGILYEWTGYVEDNDLVEDGFKELPPSKMGYKADIMSLTCLYYFEIKESTTHLPRKKKKKLALHYKKKYNKLEKNLRRKYD